MIVVFVVVIGLFVLLMFVSIFVFVVIDGWMVYFVFGNIQFKVGDGCCGNYCVYDGIDIFGVGGILIVVVYDGVIKLCIVNSGYGNYIDIEYFGGYVMCYVYMVFLGIYVFGICVGCGQQIGVVGNIGNFFVYYLYFELWLNGVVYIVVNNGFICFVNVLCGGIILLIVFGFVMGFGLKFLIVVVDYMGDKKVDFLIVVGNGDLWLCGGNGVGGFQLVMMLLGVNWGGM